MTATLTADNLRRWRADVVAFAEEVCHVKNPASGNVEPLKLADHQKAWLREATKRDADGRLARKVCVASWPKREGKSMVVSVLIAHRLVCFTGQRCGVIANSERQAASVIFSATADLFADSPALRGLVPDPGTRKLEVLATGGVLEAFPANYRTIQGIAFDLLCCDELHASEDGGKAYTFASQQTERAGAQVLIASQAGAPVDANPLWRLYHASLDGEPGVFFDYRQDVTLPWAVERAEKAKAELLPGEYDYLWRNQWGATGLKLFTVADLEVAALPYREPQTREEWTALKASWGFGAQSPVIAVGLDRAGVSRTGDRSVWTVVARFDLEEGEPLFRVVRCAVLPTGSEAEIVAEEKRTREVFGELTAALFEQYNCSDVVEKVWRAELAAPTPARQSAIFGRLARLVSEHRIAFPADAGTDPKTQTPGLLHAELLAFEYDADKASTRFGTQRGHDDCAYSLGWACEATGGLPTRSGDFRIITAADYDFTVDDEGFYHAVRRKRPEEMTEEERQARRRQEAIDALEEGRDYPGAIRGLPFGGGGIPF